jgi:hypothetical protein
MELNRAFTSSLLNLQRFLTDILINPVKIEKNNVRCELHISHLLYCLFQTVSNKFYVHGFVQYESLSIIVQQDATIYILLWEVTLLASTAFLKLYVPPGWCQMSNNMGNTDIPIWIFLVLNSVSLMKDKLDFLSSYKLQYFPCVVKLSVKML